MDSGIEGIKNEVIQEQMVVQHNIIDNIKEKKLVCHGHVRRMGEERLTKTVLRWNSSGRKKRGQPKISDRTAFIASSDSSLLAFNKH